MLGLRFFLCEGPRSRCIEEIKLPDKPIPDRGPVPAIVVLNEVHQEVPNLHFARLVTPSKRRNGIRRPHIVHADDQRLQGAVGLRQLVIRSGQHQKSNTTQFNSPTKKPVLMLRLMMLAKLVIAHRLSRGFPAPAIDGGPVRIAD